MNILVVDDEYLIREGLVDYLEKSDFIWHEIFSAENALVAKTIIENHHIDLAIVDVKMPGPSGLDLIEHFQEDEIHFILMTGYREYAYIQKAIKLSVVDFVEKPIDDLELNKAIAKTLELIEREKNLARYEHKAVLLEVLRGRKQLPSLSGYHVVSVLVLQVAHYRSYRHEIISLANEIFDEKLIDYVQAHEDTHVLLLKNQVERVKIEKFIQEFNENYQIDIAVALSSSSKAQNLSIMYQEAKLILESKLYWGYNKVLDKNHISVHKEISWPLFNELKLKFRMAIESLDLRQARFLLKDIMAMLKESRVDSLSLFTISFDLSFMVYTQSLLMNEQESKFNFPSQWDHLEEAYQYLENEIDKLESVVKWSKNFRDEANEIVDYVNDNYKNPLSLSDLSEVFLISEASVSQKIKQVTGMNFSAYLTYIRMVEAMSLLIETDLSVSEISLACGYLDYRYFSTVFKKHTGLSPSQYRTKILEKTNL